MAVLGVVFLAVVMVLIGVGIVLSLVACGLAAVLLGLGVISSSVAVGYWTKRPAAGWRALLLQAGALAGIPAGVVCAWLGVEFFRGLEGLAVNGVVLVAGALGGLVAGVLVALGVEFTTRRFHAWSVPRVAGVLARRNAPGRISRSGE